MRFFKSIKFRLTVWYLIVMVVLLLAFSVMAYFMLSNSLHQSLDDSLKKRVAEVASSIEIEDGHISFPEQPSELVWFYNTDGTLLARFGPGGEVANIDRLVAQVRGGQNSFLTAKTTDGQEVRLYATSLTHEGRYLTVIVGHSTADITDLLDRFGYILTISSLSLVVLAGIGGLFMATRALKPVNQITRTAQDISEKDLSQRVLVHSSDELGRLAVTLNRMIERLEAAFNRQRQFTADASHELRTPLSIIQAESTLALDKERAAEEYRKSLELVAQEAAHMSSIIEKLLFLARSDSGKEPFNFEEVNLKALVTDLSADAEVLCRDKGLEFILGPAENLVVKGDRTKLKQLLLNLLENAVRYTPRGGSISASAIKKGKTAVVAITDTGIGIAPEHIPQIFERFFRVDKARSRAEGGAGLGLAISKQITEAHGGRIEVESRVGKGSTFTVILPLLRTEKAD